MFLYISGRQGLYNFIFMYSFFLHTCPDLRCLSWEKVPPFYFWRHGASLRTKSFLVSRTMHISAMHYYIFVTDRGCFILREYDSPTIRDVKCHKVNRKFLSRGFANNIFMLFSTLGFEPVIGVDFYFFIHFQVSANSPNWLVLWPALGQFLPLNSHRIFQP